MDTELEYFRISPMIILSGAEAKMEIRSVDTVHGLQSGKTYDVHILPMDQRVCFDPAEETVIYSLPCLSRALTFSHAFRSEQQYCILIHDADTCVAKLYVYCLFDDLYQRIPFAGCMHAHSDYSDGQEAPAVVAACYRIAGFDFLSITDHGMYKPSLEAIDAYAGLNLDFRLFPGEEVHAPGNRVHIINFAGTESVNTYCADHKEEYLAQVEAIRQQLELPAGNAGFEYASSLWVFRKIREFGGMSILCHPSWIEENQYNIPSGMYRRFLEEHPFDVLELLNGGNTLWEQAD